MIAPALTSTRGTSLRIWTVIVMQAHLHESRRSAILQSVPDWLHTSSTHQRLQIIDEFQSAST
jgi:hypothetical protein